VSKVTLEQFLFTRLLKTESSSSSWHSDYRHHPAGGWQHWGPRQSKK